jgi:signal transduction histidine kinase
MDITARKTAEARLRAFAEELERSNQALQDFAYVASHDLQEPLRKMRTFGEMMRKSCLAALPKEGAFFLERMEHAANRMQTLIRDLLALSRVSTAGEAFTSVNLSEVAREVVSDLEGRLQKNGGSVVLDLLPVLHGDPTQMRQLLQNLIGNALKFQRPGVPPVVQVRAREYEDDAARTHFHGAVAARWCELSVEDNGIGFEQKHAERVFAPFQRLHGKDAYEGTGMGLSICRKIAERHGGTIIARSKPGEGATFTVTLPLDRKPSSASHFHE